MTIKDNVDHEDEYFHREDQAKLDKLRGEVSAESAATEAEAAKALHFHKCGKCGADMDTMLFKGVEIEKCPSCGAVLLDPGELEELAGEDESGFFSGLFGS
jgi:rubrerythrin